MNPSELQNLNDYSPSSTTIKFNHPIPLIRGPIPTSYRDSPSSGAHVLAFRSPDSWASAYKACQSKITDQCEGGARVGCAIAASEKCKPPWWRNLIGGAKLEDLKERERCEEREMEECMSSAKEKCVGFASNKCWRPFNDARIVVTKDKVERLVVKKLASLVSLPESSKWVGLIGDVVSEIDVTNQRASELLAGDVKYEWFFSAKLEKQ
ncbi:hypothetical protein K2173_025720 [Erythroxylum novogranatense]|uniref:Uncharacterized protein n=1 Tax=Erythroxylum novogranatense TaxID=1862640 RepID=A0AAV8SBV3_9ROSI|nr:hypothetical protein K2173_025720 [Erythroxylum novogranatense]